MTNVPKSSNRNPRRLICRIILVLLAVLFLAFNAIACRQAWVITHYAPTDVRTTRLGEIHTQFARARLLLLGGSIRRMINTTTPAHYDLPYRTVTFPGSHGARLEAWCIPGVAGHPSVLMFPGYGASKDTLLKAAVEFHAAGCEAWLVDFSGIGGSEGHTTTIGWREAEDVAAAVHATEEQRTGPLVLYGTSMGSSAILCAQHRGLVAPDAIIVECPFDRLSKTIGIRLQFVGMPEYPLAPAIALWIGAQNGFNGLAHNPVNYARSVRCPVLLMQGEDDRSVGQPAAQAIGAALGDRATVKIFPNCGHAFLVRDGEAMWRTEVRRFLATKVPASGRTLGVNR